MRIVSLLPCATETLFALGLGDQVLAVSHECDYPPAARLLPKVTRSLLDSSRTSRQIDIRVQSLTAAGAALYEIDAAEVCAQRPELIVTQAQCDVCAVRYQDVIDLIGSEPSLRETRVLALNPQSLQEILGDALRVAVACGAAEQGQKFMRSLVERVDRVREKTAALLPQQRPRVVCLEWLDPPMAAGNWTPELIGLAGGTSGLAKPGQHSEYVNLVDVLDYDPQALILAPCGFDLDRTIAEAQPLIHSPIWGRISACLQGGVYALDGNAYLNRSGPRIVDTLEILSHLLHPRLFPPPAWSTPDQNAWTPLVLRAGRLTPVSALAPE